MQHDDRICTGVSVFYSFLSLSYYLSLSSSIALKCEVFFYVLVYIIALIIIRLQVKAEVPVSKPNEMRVIFGDIKTTGMSEYIKIKTVLFIEIHTSNRPE